MSNTFEILSDDKDNEINNSIQNWVNNNNIILTNENSNNIRRKVLVLQRITITTKIEEHILTSWYYNRYPAKN